MNKLLFLLLCLTSCGATSDCIDRQQLTICEINTAVLRWELCSMGKIEYCGEPK